MRDITCLIKTFKRPECLERLLASLYGRYPQLRTIIVDDSPQPYAERMRLERFAHRPIRVCELPPDQGLSTGRNHGLALIETPYFLLLDDDFVFRADTNLERLQAALENSELDIAGGSIVQYDPAGAPYVWSWEGTLLRVRETLIGVPLAPVDDVTPCDVVLNFFLARTAAVRNIDGWDPALKLCEHTDFFLRAQQGALRVGYVRGVLVDHCPVRDPAYTQYRCGNLQNYHDLWMRKHQIIRFVTFQGRVEVRSDHIPQRYQPLALHLPVAGAKPAPQTARTQPPQLIVGLGSGRCGTLSLAQLLGRQPDTVVEHESAPLLPWDARLAPHTMRERFAALAAANPQALRVGDVAFYYLPYVEQILRELPETRLLCLRRDRAATVESFARWITGHYGHGTVDHWRADRSGLMPNYFDRCFPKYPVPTMREALERYWDDYYAQAETLARRYPGQMRIFEMEPALGTPDGVRELLDWAGIPRESQVLRSVHVHQSAPSATPAAADWRSAVTCVVKTFERPDCLRRLLRSLYRHDPAMRTIVVDDSHSPYAERIRREEFAECPLEVLELPPDQGISAGRNAGLARVSTPYFLLFDDDVVLRGDTRLKRLYDVAVHGGWDIVGGGLVEHNEQGQPAVQVWQGHFVRVHSALIGVPLTPDRDVIPCDVVQNFLLARTAAVQAIGGWDAALKIIEHEDFFLRARRHGLRVAFARGVLVDHEPQRNPVYRRYRVDRSRHYQQQWMTKHGLSAFIGFAEAVAVNPAVRPALNRSLAEYWGTAPNWCDSGCGGSEAAVV